MKKVCVALIALPMLTMNAQADDHPYVNDMRQAAKTQADSMGLFAAFFSLFTVSQTLDPKNAPALVRDELMTQGTPSTAEIAADTNQVSQEIDKIMDDIGDPYAITSGGRDSKGYE